MKDHWDTFIEINGDKVRKVVKEDIKRMINCGELSNGYAVYECTECGEAKKVAFRCKSRVCSSCGKVYVDERADKMASKMVKSTHRHMVFTIPEELRIYFQRERKLLSLLPQVSYEVIRLYLYEQNKSEGFVPGVVSVIHTFGRDLKWNPHVHVLVTEGGVGKKTDWRRIKYFHYGRLRKSWQKALLSGLEKAIKKKKRAYKDLKKKLYAKYQEGFYVYGERRIKSAKEAIRYVGRYTGRPAISESRIKSYDGETVTYYYDDHESGSRIEVKESAIEFIKKVIIHIADRGFKMIRYYGIYANRQKREVKVLKMLEERIKEEYAKLKSWRMRIVYAFGHDPLRCEKCGGKLKLKDIVYPKYGSVLEKIEERMKKEVEANVYAMQRDHAIIKEMNQGLEPLYV